MNIILFKTNLTNLYINKLLEKYKKIKFNNIMI